MMGSGKKIKCPQLGCGSASDGEADSCRTRTKIEKKKSMFYPCRAEVYFDNALRVCSIFFFLF